MLDTNLMTAWEKDLFPNEAAVIRNHLNGGVPAQRAADLLGIAKFELDEILATHWNKDADQIAQIIIALG